MRKTIILVFLLPMFISCNKDNTTLGSFIDVSYADLVGDWFRSEPTRVWSAEDENKVRGETHYTVSFYENGAFEYNRTTLGLYEKTTIEDTTGFRIQHGSYVLNENQIEIDIDVYTWFDTFYGDMIEPETNYYDSNYKFLFLDASVEINDDILTFIHYTLTDLLDPSQETPGLDKNENDYVRLR
jgi:hypothetical protein